VGIDRESLKRGAAVVLFPLTGGIEGEPAPNPRLYGQPALVVAVTAWGAVVQPMDGGPTFRAGWDEMKLQGGDEDGREAADPGRNGSMNGSYRPRDMGYTGDICPRCGSSKVRRSGKCAVCEECGDGVGDCS
jgi:hypothetical protein